MTIAETLFAAPARVETARPARWRGIALGAAAVAAGTALGLLRQPGAGALDTIWAEDGGIFLAEAVRQGPFDALLTSYAGYFHAVPRLMAAVATLFPAGAASTVLALEAALAVSLLAVLVFAASGSHLTGTLSRVLVSAVVVVVPVAQGDVLNSIANFHWYGLYALFWILIWTPSRPAGRAVAVAVTFLVAASDIVAVVFVPLALWRMVHRPDGASRRVAHGAALAGGLGAGLLIQFAGLLSGSSERDLSPDPVLAVSGFLLRAVPAPLIGERWLGDGVDARWVALAAVAWLVVAAALLAAYTRRTRPAWTLAVVAGLHAAALYMLPVLLAGTATPRYAVAPAMLVVTALVALLRPAGSRIPLYALAALLALVAAVNLRVDNTRADGPLWSDELERARTACATGDQATVPITPRDATPPWQVRVPCDYVR
ncbi:hypothetical protein RB614_34485 [Phytohabitans sp. ZYX-F-186]|uniref:Glycosyltransferase RgtA/B/C/D-like domain-containing protein n=1 Tax=Phytohabitans maris TaxID=3071409 RepID=A0ABU0ZRK1_9ACTN|nr:hypothetical protein [Phytohabitans sp. ZYX-F-186]MDQ7909641.1 hypothetical protein [Phytohabitans sp. ZYX-F-186]